MHGMNRFVVVALFACLMVSPACALLNSFSESSGSVSSISESVSDSSTSSSGGDSAWFRIEEDVRVYTAREAVEGTPVDAYLRGIGELCDRHAVSDWEAHPAVYRGIGAGLAEARVDEDDALRFARDVAGRNDDRVAVVHAAYLAALR